MIDYGNLRIQIDCHTIILVTYIFKRLKKAPDDLKAETIPPINYEKILKKRKKGKNESLRDTYKHKKRAVRN